MAGRKRIAFGVLLVVFAIPLFAVPSGAGIGLGVFFAIIGILLILWGARGSSLLRPHKTAQPVFSAAATAGPATCRACGMTNMLGATRCSRCGSPL
jgi:uncharacterized paraquat-inducible protein A